VRWDTPEDFARLARSLAERAVGLVLGGGGARCFAQIGVIRALRECGIPIDSVGGTSMGAIVAAACAMGWDHAAMVRLARRAFVESKSFLEYTLPMISFIRGRRLDRVSREIFGDTQVEDLWIPQFSVSSNLTTTEPIVHRRGPVWKAVRASGSLPGVLPPVLAGRHLLVDGGVLNNLPGDVMRARSGGPLIVVDVAPEEDLHAECDCVPSPWWMLWKRLRSGRGGAGMPGIFDIMIRATLLSSIRAAKAMRKEADLYLHPPVQCYGMLQFDAIEQIVETGYQYALRQIELFGGREKLCAASAGITGPEKGVESVEKLV
jgi:NTE family protein/lysophospholipid hydrolase